MVRVIAVDLDDTLLDSEKKITPENAQAIAWAREQGVRVVISTARGWPGTESYYRLLNLDTPAIISSGARLVDGDGREIWMRAMPQALAEAVLAFGNAHQIPLRIYTSATVWNNLDHDPRGLSTTAKGVPMQSGQTISEPVYQIYTKGEREAELLVQQFSEAGAGYRANVLTYADGIPEVCFLHPQSNKGAALAALCAEWQVPAEEVMALGDSMNDLSMLEWAGIGVAMPWGAERLRELADWVLSIPDAITRAVKEQQTPTRQGLK